MTDVRIEHDYIEIDTAAWIAARTDGEITELTALYQDFDRALRDATSLRLSTIDLFITARAGADWRDADHAMITTADGGGPVNLSEDLIIRAYTDPEHGDVVFIATEDHGFTGEFTAYTESCEPEDWYDAHDAEINCPTGHGWLLRGAELTDDQGDTHRIEALYPDGQPITIDQNPDSPTHGQPHILCPTCHQPCTLDLPHVG